MQVDGERRVALERGNEVGTLRKISTPAPFEETGKCLHFLFFHANLYVASMPSLCLACSILVGLFFVGNVMQYTKPALTYEEQADRLLERGLSANRDLLISRLNVSGAWRSFWNAPSWRTNKTYADIADCAFHKNTTRPHTSP